jgi:hypothetical protein
MWRKGWVVAAEEVKTPAAAKLCPVIETKAGFLLVPDQHYLQC